MKTAISLFSGAGGCSLGFSWAGFEILLAIDNAPASVATYRLNFSQTLCWQRDIRQLSAKHILDAVGLAPGELDFLIGGPPCQGFSSAGARFWDDPRNQLLHHYIRLLQGIKPRWFLMENVEGLLTADNGRYIYEVTKGFLDIGYNVQLHKMYCHWYGLPQVRKRVFLVGTTGIEHFSFPEPTHDATPSLFDTLPMLTIMDALADLPPVSADPASILPYQQPPYNDFQRMMRGKDVRDHWVSDLKPDALERIAMLRPGQTMKDLPKDMQHPSFKRRAYRRVMDGTPTEKRGGAPAGLKRLEADKPCLTITSAAIREFVHPFEDRYLTLRECARIQSFPDSFVFDGNRSAIAQMIGNAIPPLIAKQLATHFEHQSKRQPLLDKNGAGHLIGYYLTKAQSMSPALSKTRDLLHQLQIENS